MQYCSNIPFPFTPILPADENVNKRRGDRNAQPESSNEADVDIFRRAAISSDSCVGMIAKPINHALCPIRSNKPVISQLTGFLDTRRISARKLIHFLGGKMKMD